MAEKDEQDRRGITDSAGRVVGNGTEKEISLSLPDGTGDSRDPEGEKIETQEGRPGGAGGPDIDGFVDPTPTPTSSVPVPTELDELLVKVGQIAGANNLIFVGGLIPFKRADKGRAPWEIDTDKDPIRISNIEESESVRISMALLAYLMEIMQADLVAELGVKVIPGTEGQVPS